MSVPTDPFNVPPQPKPGMSTGGKVLLGLGVGCGVVLLLCCGVVGFAGYYFREHFQLIQEPDQVLSVAQNIVSVEVPVALEPMFGYDPVVPFLNQKIGSAVLYAEPGKQSFLFLAQGGDDKQRPLAVSIQFAAIVESQGHRFRLEPAPLTGEPETVSVEVHGEPAAFEVGKAQSGSQEVWQAVGDFTGKTAPATLVLQLDAAQYSKDDAIAIIQSLK